LVHNGSKDAYDISLTVELKSNYFVTLGSTGKQPTIISTSNLKYMYWTFKQMVAHHTINGCNMRTGDLLGTGTISGPTSDSLGSLLEITSNGKESVQIDGSTRTFLQDGDEVVMKGVCGDGIGFGNCGGIILPANQ
jgi:fumarylacetoacetase